MRRWNGWGDDQFNLDIPEGGQAFLASRIGSAKALNDTSLTDVCASVPATRLPDDPRRDSLIDTSAETRARHARGQSLADWLALRSGDIGTFPDGVAFPKTNTDVRALLHYAQDHDLHLIPYGGGTSVAGHINPIDQGKPILTVSLAEMNRLIDLDRQSQLATFGAGTPGPLVESQLRAHGYTLGHFPQSFELSTIGGWVASRSSGQQSLRYGRIEQLFAGGGSKRCRALSTSLPFLPPARARTFGKWSSVPRAAWG